MGGITNIINLDSDNTVVTGSKSYSVSSSSIGTTATVLPTVSVGSSTSCKKTGGGYSGSIKISVPSSGRYFAVGHSGSSRDNSSPTVNLSGSWTATSTPRAPGSEISGASVTWDKESYWYYTAIAVGYRVE